MNDDVKMITIPEIRYKELLRDSEVLAALHMGGVDNWEWYGDSLRDAGLKYFDDEDEEEDDE